VTATLAEVAASEEAADPGLLEWLLDLFDNTLIYRARHTHQPEWSPTVELLLFDRHNPRSLTYQLGKLAKHVRLLPASGLGELIRESQLLRASCDMPVPALAGFLGECEGLARRLSDAITLRYFSHVYEPARATAVLRWGRSTAWSTRRATCMSLRCRRRGMSRTSLPERCRGSGSPGTSSPSTRRPPGRAGGSITLATPPITS
jgi:hypothetical protein